MRILHTADIHLDACFVAPAMPAGYGNRRRQALRDVFQGIVRRAAAWPADALVIAGDLFEHSRVSRDTIAFLQDLFASIPHVPVYIAPGNHDPYMPGSPYMTERWPGHVHVFRTAEWDAFEHAQLPLTIHGFAFDGPDISVNPFGALALPNDDRVHIAVGHGSETGNLPKGKTAYAPFKAAEAAAPGLAYLALGHYHGYKEITGGFATRIAYSGAPEGHGFGEPGLRYHLEVEIAGDGEVDVKPVRSCKTAYEAHAIDCSAYASTQQLVEAVRMLPHESGVDRIGRIVLSGSVLPEIQSEFAAARDAIAEMYAFLDLNDETEPLEDYEALEEEHTSFGAFVKRINAEIKDTTDPERLAMLRRAREVGCAAYRNAPVPVAGMEGD